MKQLSRVNLTEDLRERVIARYGSLTAAARALGMSKHAIYRAFNPNVARNQKDSVTMPIRLLKRLGYSVRYVIVDDLLPNGSYANVQRDAAGLNWEINP